MRRPIILDHSLIIEVMEPFRTVNTKLIELLESLPPEAWSLPTVHPQRTVKDLVAHLLHGSLRRVTGVRDRYKPPDFPTFKSHKEIVDYVQSNNTDFMKGMSHVSPNILIEMIRQYDPIVMDLFSGLDPEAPGLGVTWAGEWSSPNWFDIAREYTEKWHHQQQIRDATSQPDLYDCDLFSPVLETFARGLPHAFRDYSAPVDCRISIQLTGSFFCGWNLKRAPNRWILKSGVHPKSQTHLSLPSEVAWKAWTKSMPKEEFHRYIQVDGDPKTVSKISSFVAVMA